MTHLNIQQGLNIEVVNTNLIKKLYEAALSVPEPLEGELDAAYMSGNLLVDKSYRSLVEYLTNRFDDLHINVTAGYYILFHDNAVNNVLKDTIGDGIGVLDTLLNSITNLNTLGLVNNTDITDFREGIYLTNSQVNGSTGFVNGCTNLDVLGIPPNLSYYNLYIIGNAPVSKFIISNWAKWVNAEVLGNNFNNVPDGYKFYEIGLDGELQEIQHLILPEGCTFTLQNMDKVFAFRRSGLLEITIPTSMTNVGFFLGSLLKYLHFATGSLTKSICERCFYNCSNLEFDVSNLPNTITSIGWRAFEGCSKVTGALNLPNLTIMPAEAFVSTGILGITNLGSIDSISEHCFKNCTHLTSVTLPNTCTTINKYGFGGCTNLTNIDLGGVTTLGYSAFENDSNLTSVTGIENLTTIEKRAFCKCGLTGTLDLRNVSVLGNYPFYKCNITKIKLPSTFSNITYRDAGLEWNVRNITNDTGNLFIGLPLLTTIETDFALWTTFPKFRGCYNLVPFVLYLPNVTFINAAIIGGGYHIDQHWGNMSWNSSFYYPNVTEVHDASGYMYINHYRDNQGLFCQGEGSVLIDLLYLKSIQTLNYASFYHVTSGKIVINNTTVPTVVLNSQGSSTTTTVNYFETPGNNGHVDFYVPDSAVNDYKAAWPNHASDIYGISQLNGGVIYATEADYNTVSTNVQTKPVGLIAEYLGLSTADLATFVSANNLTYYTPPSS